MGGGLGGEGKGRKWGVEEQGIGGLVNLPGENESIKHNHTNHMVVGLRMLIDRFFIILFVASAVGSLFLHLEARSSSSVRLLLCFYT